MQGERVEGKCPRGWTTCTDRKSISHPELTEEQKGLKKEIVQMLTEEQRNEPDRFVRLANGNLSNCSLAHGDDEEDCQICGGQCPDKARLIQGALQTIKDAGMGETEAKFAQIFSDINKKTDEILSRGKERLSEIDNKKHTIPNELDPGDLIEVTIGQETFAPGTGGSFTVGPITVKTVVRPPKHVGLKAETCDEAFIRAQYVASLMFEAEFELKQRAYFERVKEVNQRCQDESQSLSH
jgi:hypothetical protein